MEGHCTHTHTHTSSSCMRVCTTLQGAQCSPDYRLLKRCHFLPRSNAQGESALLGSSLYLTQSDFLPFVGRLLQLDAPPCLSPPSAGPTSQTGYELYTHFQLFSYPVPPSSLPLLMVKVCYSCPHVTGTLEGGIGN